jgi:hypothetical protein
MLDGNGGEWRDASSEAWRTAWMKHGSDQKDAIVQLDQWEVRVCNGIGAARQAEARRKKLKPIFAYRDEAEALLCHQRGARAECAAAKWLGIYWNMGINTFRDVPDIGRSDLGSGIEVRWSARPALRVRKMDPAQTPVVLVNGDGARLRLCGWELAGQARIDYEPTAPNPDGPPAWFVPEKNLQPMGRLPRHLLTMRMGFTPGFRLKEQPKDFAGLKRMIGGA